VAVEVHHLHLVEFIGFELFVVLVDHPGGTTPLLIPRGRSDTSVRGNFPSCTREPRPDVRDALHDTVIALVGGVSVPPGTW